MDRWNRRCFMRHTLWQTAALAAASTGVRAAESFPARPLVLMVPYPAGGASDVAARIFAESIGRSLGQQVVVDNLGGGTGLIAAARVLNAPADGYMFFHGSANEVFLAPMLNPAARYKPGDFTLAAPTTDAAIVLLVRSDLPVNTYDEFIAHASQSAGKPLTYATVGVDSMYHLMGEALATRLKLPFLHVPYKGGAPALQDVAGGQVDFAILAYQASFDGMAKQGRLKILTSFSKALPRDLGHIPLISQSRHSPDFEYTIGGGYFVKKGTPADRVAVLRSAVGEALVNPDIRSKLEAEGRHFHQPIRSQAEADQSFNAQYQRLTRLIDGVGRKPLA
ncbi:MULTISPECIES: tripartite tricarboxylate transporter substrate binding protein [Comamonas]|uniref:Tripartite tricarboxylate transporter substrate binding protein n=1 Tax=Comamonas testosteroni (strain DSM 14576 / KF-1) TaxID=399795 RepID=B7X0K7_COMTK|nr:MULTISPECIES: tripartite tricarboxylate transporter substrate binding protein [Comamonas]EED66357.1 conserved hypothetical protein [Comamonas testosteroni KF-1]TYK68328.1 tripartite tricarboxylate transporter substrate binding protein [Comamonas sp. Z3]